MTESKFYSELLGLEMPWEVESVELDKQAMEVLVKVRCKQSVWVCPDTRERVHIHEWNTRRWRHLDTCQFRTVIEAKVPLEQLITHRYTLDQAVEAFRTFDGATTGKCVFVMD